MGTKEYEMRGAKHCEEVVMETANVLLVGDNINITGATFGWGTVVCVTEKEVEIVRPYIHTSDFTVCAGFGNIGERLISYTGMETVKISRDSKNIYTVVFRTTVPR